MTVDVASTLGAASKVGVRELYQDNLACGHDEPLIQLPGPSILGSMGYSPLFGMFDWSTWWQDRA